LDTARYKAFLATTETGSFTKAAELLCYTPSGVSQLINALEKEFKVTSIENTTEIEVGSEVVTNGLGGLYPNGIFIGTVSKITKDEIGVSIVLKVKSKVDFTNIGYVFVLGK